VPVHEPFFPAALARTHVHFSPVEKPNALRGLPAYHALRVAIIIATLLILSLCLYVIIHTMKWSILPPFAFYPPPHKPIRFHVLLCTQAMPWPSGHQQKTVFMCVFAVAGMSQFRPSVTEGALNFSESKTELSIRNA
jgi:hypothetical protein